MIATANLSPRMSHPDCSLLDMAEAVDVTRAGGKAAALARLAAAGFDVPAFFVIPPEAFEGATLSREARAAIADALTRIGSTAFAVRSSAIEEDGVENSHAGQFLSVLEVSPADVADASERVARSGFGASLTAYRQSRGLAAAGSGVAVIVQRLVPARAAGVAFSADPVSGRRDRIVVSATSGLADRLVGGEVDGDTYLLARDGRVVGRAEEARSLSETDLSKLAALAIAVEAASGSPQDIEWAFEGERLLLLQSRPITTPLRPLPQPDPLVTILDNSNIVESYPGLVSPLTYSFAQYVYGRVYRTFLGIVGVNPKVIAEHGCVLDNMLARHRGRVYYNLMSWYRLLALLPGFRLNRAHMETMMGVGEPLPRDIADSLAPPAATGLGRLREWSRVGWMASRLGVAALGLPRSIRSFETRLGSALARDRAELKSLPLTALAAEYRRIESRLLDHWDAPLVNDFLCMVAFGASRRMLERWAGAEGIALHNAMMIGQGDIVSAEPPRRIAEMGRLAAGNDTLIAALDAGDRTAAQSHPALARLIDAYVARFGDRCTEELKLESITLAEDPAPLLRSIAAAARVPHNMELREASHGSADLARVLAGRPLKRIVARMVLSWAKARVRDRENLRFERTRVFGHARQVFLAIGAEFVAHGVIEDARDVFFLTLPEVLGAIEGHGVSADLAGFVALRKDEAVRNGALPDPPERITLNGAAIVHNPPLAVDPAAARPVAGSEADRQRTGTGCSAGTLSGRARVVTDPRGMSLEPGEILVARHTDPGWIAVFANAAGIVVERGSLLSHSAIVAREMGIPCVVGLKGATSWLRTGDVIEIDGATGTVWITAYAD
ncbi:MAG: PEP/pyruvate-binding domain-containing protein [Hyphomicrobiaceae bacterium]|nr:PEP/pyruvate-binding domain-containing protein [Hyphomicrobiaceae bacterium]